MLLFIVITAAIRQIDNMTNPWKRLRMQGASHFNPLSRIYNPEVKKPKPTGGKGKGKDKFRDLMALVKWSGIGMVGGSGKVGGTILNLSGSAGTAWVRNWAKPANARTILQQFTRGLFSGVSSSYRTLSPAQISAWANAAVDYVRRNIFGDNKSMTSNQAFMHVQKVLLQNNALAADLPADPPAITATDSILDSTVVADVSGNQFDVTLSTFGGATQVPADTVLEVYATRQVSNGKRFFKKSDYRFLAAVVATTSIAPLNLYALYTNYFGALQANTNIGLQFRFVTYSGSPITTFGLSGKFFAVANVVA